jgi:hypothetical protein
MRLGIFCAVVALSVVPAGCASVKIDVPVNGKTNVTVPEEVVVSKQGTASLGRVFVDNQDVSTINNQNWQWTPRFWVSYAAPGQHSVFVEARNIKTNENLGQTTTFDVSACPLCYSCPVGNVHPINGQCCANGVCDVFAAGNSGVTHINFQVPGLNLYCSKEVAPGVNEFYYQRGCIASAITELRGTGVASPETAAVRFVAGQTGTITHLRIPVDIESGPPTLRVFLAADAPATDGMGQPGAALASVDLPNVRLRNLPTRNPVNVFVNNWPMITAGTTYWLVVAPGSPTTVAGWNRSLDDVSIPNTTTLKVNRTTSTLTGPWVAKSNLQELVPAYEISVRP